MEKLIFILLLCHLTYGQYRRDSRSNIILVPQQIVTNEGEDYTLHMKIINKDVNIKECYADNDIEEKYSIDFTKIGVKGKIVDGNPSTNKTGDVITSLGNNICGFKITNAQFDSIKEWTIITIDSKGQNYVKNTRVIVYKRPSIPKLITQDVVLGDSISFGSFISSDKNAFYSEIYSPKGELVIEGLRDNQFSMKVTKKDYIGDWKYVFLNKLSMSPIEVIYRVNLIEKDVIEYWQNETDKVVNLGCRVINPKIRNNFCIMVRPDGVKFNVDAGMATDRYTSIQSDFQNDICSLQIKKPLQKSEIGTWTCRYFIGIEKPMGAFINVGSTHIAPEPNIPKSIFVHVNDTLDIKCQVNYPTPYCYFRSPSGVIYTYDDNRAKTLGLCEFSKKSIDKNDNGTWICGFSKINGDVDDTFTVPVHVFEVVPIRAEETEVTTKKGSTTIIKCTTAKVGGYPLNFCRFLSPNGKFFYPVNDNSTSRIKYHGKGIENGECGIEISPVEDSDDGIWSCLTEITYGNFKNDGYANVKLTISSESGVSTASAIGIAFGVIFIVSGFGFIGYRRWRRFNRNIENVNFSRNTMLRASNESVVDISSNPQGSQYNTVN